MYTSKNDGLRQVYAKTGSQRQRHGVNSEEAKHWHEATGDFCGGVMVRYREPEKWPMIRRLFQNRARHGVEEIAGNIATRLGRSVRVRPVPEDDL
jgi:hypothetical protein